jgi:hypothetical protein
MNVRDGNHGAHSTFHACVLGGATGWQMQDQPCGQACPTGVPASSTRPNSMGERTEGPSGTVAPHRRHLPSGNTAPAVPSGLIWSTSNGSSPNTRTTKSSPCHSAVTSTSWSCSDSLEAACSLSPTAARAARNASRFFGSCWSSAARRAAALNCSTNSSRCPTIRPASSGRANLAVPVKARRWSSPATTHRCIT